MEKPISILANDFKKNITSVINSSGLPVFVIEQILCNLYNQVKELANSELVNDIQEFKKSQSDELNE